HEVLGIELNVEPGTAVRNDTGGVQQLAGAVGLALVVVEEHAGGAVQLAYYHTLGTVDDEGAGIGHERNLAQVHFLLLDVLDDFGRAFLLVNDQAHFHAQAHRIGGAAQDALTDVEFGFSEAVAHVLEQGLSGVADDGEDRLERGLQADIKALLGWGVCLGELPVGIYLDSQKIRNIHRTLEFSKVLADTFFLGVCVSHQRFLSTGSQSVSLIPSS